ncbi:hypothetical protein SLEP1_g46484 [Rubroshorea leprosula]|uniref:Uncharacterized protein n=1 Tax=Rubroshorea leprosula TaxID=152421 RepID=A0AAV5LN82_9ROSI|nr:hypothetical protein SLEP1_g46484 [Rubroshorea leprosula]
MEEDNLPRIRDVPVKKRHELFMKKLRLCSESLETIIPIDTKLKILKELLDYVPSLDSLPDDVVQLIKEMVAANIFRPFPSPSAHVSDINYETDELYDPEIKRPLVEESWFFLRHVYQFLRYVVDAGLLRDDHTEDSFVKTLLNIALDADDHREAISVTFLLAICTSQSAVCPLLSFANDRIRELWVPLLAENRMFLERVLIPMHKISSYSIYSRCLSQCMLAFLAMDSELDNLMIRGIFSGRQRPLRSTCEIELLDELKSLMTHTLLGRITPSNAELVFRWIAKCLTSLHAKVVTKALNILKWPRFILFAKQRKQVSVPIITPALENVGNQFLWDNNVRELAARVREQSYNENDADWQFGSRTRRRKRWPC